MPGSYSVKNHVNGLCTACLKNNCVYLKLDGVRADFHITDAHRLYREVVGFMDFFFQW